MTARKSLESRVSVALTAQRSRRLSARQWPSQRELRHIGRVGHHRDMMRFTASPAGRTSAGFTMPASI